MRRPLANTLLLAGLGLIANACATSTPAPLLLARISYDALSAGSAAAVTPSYVSDARESLDKANREFATNGDTPICRDYSYIAQNKIELAESAVRAEIDRLALDAAAPSDPRHAAAASNPLTVASH